MTICIGALCEGGKKIVCVTDRMLTYRRGVTAESDQTKAWCIRDSVHILAAGDMGIHAELYERTKDWARASAQCPSVGEVARFYADQYTEVRREAAGRAILAPLGLTHEVFVQNQIKAETSLVKLVADELLAYQPTNLGVDSLIVGCDADGQGSIYAVHYDTVTCCNSVGSATVGSGAEVAEQQIAAEGHTRGAGEGETLWLMYLAKRRAEVVYGVGSQTTLLLISGQDDAWRLDAAEIPLLRDLFRDVQESENRAFGEAKEHMSRFMQEVRRASGESATG